MVAENKPYKFMSRDLTGDEWGQAWSLQLTSFFIQDENYKAVKCGTNIGVSHIIKSIPFPGTEPNTKESLTHRDGPRETVLTP
jgi:hypothetical protein